MAFIDDLQEGGGNFIFKRTEGGASLSPTSDRDADLTSFQNLVRRVRANEGDGYSIHLEHACADRPGGLIDLIVLAIDD
ncbi:hypothetical protein OF829_11750 [Sphingomonas sp. LB-2]|uniref:hypothetical protein n=1 Tax=Sphingomonas caeni TaxID=2984949 RepID=UPI0022302EE5|nr:hypothetical protein [Sphingomonas caeni]MCW3847915.1 hypothetical protein [Sphingomonas caeni]